MSELNPGLIFDPVFVGATRPPMRWGVTYSALLFNMVFTMGLIAGVQQLLDPCRGEIRWRAGDARRSP